MKNEIAARKIWNVLIINDSGRIDLRKKAQHACHHSASLLCNTATRGALVGRTNLTLRLPPVAFLSIGLALCWPS